MTSDDRHQHAPCPICGGMPVLMGDGAGVSAFCLGCHHSGSTHTDAASAWAAWDRDDG